MPRQARLGCGEPRREKPLCGTCSREHAWEREGRDSGSVLVTDDHKRGPQRSQSGAFLRLPPANASRPVGSAVLRKLRKG